MMGYIRALALRAFMLDALLTAANHLLHLSGHSWLLKLVMQQAQLSTVAMVSSITVTSIPGSYLVGLVDYESQNVLQFASGGVVMVEGSLVEHYLLLLLENSITLFSICIISQQ